MNIRKIETFTTRNLSVVRVQTDDGQVGYGQIAPYHANISALVLHQQVAPRVLGKRSDEISSLVEMVIREEHKFPGSYVCRAVGGLETALWDALGKRHGKSVCELLGGTPKEVKLYGSSMRRDISPKEEAERLVRLQEQFGYEAFKIRIGSNFGNDVDVYPGRTEQVVAEVRKALGDQTLIYVDANSGFTPQRAIEVGKYLEQQGVVHYEEPCPYPELEWTKQVADALDIAVTGGEQDTDLAQFRRMITMGAVDVVQPDICYIGGIDRAMQVARMAEQAGIPCTPHAANLSMVTVFTLHMVGAINNAGPYMEFTIEQDSWSQGLLETPLQVRSGAVNIPTGPGWGVEISQEWLNKAEYAVSER